MHQVKTQAKQPPAGRLTTQQELFCQEYLIDLDPGAAARRAGYAATTSKARGMRLLSSEIIRNRVTDLIQGRMKRTQISQDRVLQEMSNVAFSDIRKLFDEEGRPLRPHEWPDDIAPAVSSVKVKDDGTVEFRLWDKGKSLEMVAKHLGMLVEQVHHSGSIDVLHLSDDQLLKELRKLREETDISVVAEQ